MHVIDERLLQTPHYATEPHAALSAGGDLLLATAERNAAGQEQIVVRRLPPTADGFGEPSSTTVFHTPHASSWPTVVDTSFGTFVAFVDIPPDDMGLTSLHLRRLSDPTRDVFHIFAPNIIHPTLVARGGALFLAWAARDDHNRHRLKAAFVDPTHTHNNVHDLGGRVSALVRRPTAALLPDGRALVVWEQHGAGHIRLDGALIERPGNVTPMERLVTADGFLQAPALSVGPDGRIWLAWSSDVPLGPPPHLPRWTQLAEVRLTDTGATVHPTRQHPRGMDLDASGEDQSLEFPALCVGGAGDVFIAARASHNFRVQRFGTPPDAETTWSEPLPLSSVLWGCRGVRLTALTRPDGHVVVVGHDRKGVTVRTLAVEPWQAPDPDAVALHTPPDALTPPHRLTTVRPRWERGLEDGFAWFGDIHYHSAASDGVGTIEEGYLRCRDRYGLDFACLTDHDAFLGRRVTLAAWRAMKEAAEAFDLAPNAFTTLIGIEYTGSRFPGPGHKCVYFDDASAPLVCRADGLDAPEDLLARVAAAGGFAIPHHVGWLGGDPEHHDPAVQPCWELCSAHGQYECPPDDLSPPPLAQRPARPEDEPALAFHYLRRQLEQGAIFGFSGGSDGHGLLWHHGISPRPDSHRTGLTGVFAPTLARHAILDAIRHRRTFATTGDPIALAFLAEDAPMGSILPGPRASLDLELLFFADQPATLEVFAPRHGRTTPLATLPSTPNADGAPFVARLTVDLHPDDQANGFLYVRAICANGATAWASPVFWRTA